MKYLIIGAGGTGGAVGSYLARAGQDVTFIARGAHLSAMRANGLRVVRPKDEFTIPAQAYTMEEYAAAVADGGIARPDVIFVCVKSYSVDDALYDFLGCVSGPETVIIPILNIYGTGGHMQKRLPGVCVTDGCIYVAAQIREPGCIQMNGDILRVVFGLRGDEDVSGFENVRVKTGFPAEAALPEKLTRKLEQIRDDLCAAKILGIFSEDIRRDALLKFSYVSPQGACGVFYNVPAGPIQQPGVYRDCFAELVHEVDVLAEAMGIHFQEDIVARNLAILDDLGPSATTSMQRDIDAGKDSEVDGLVYEVVRLGEQYGVKLPEYEKIAAAMKERGL